MPELSRHTVGLVGAGKVGVVLSSALVRAGHTVTAVWDPASAALAKAQEVFGQFRTPREPWDIRSGNDLILIAVPDDALAGLVETLAEKGGETWLGTTVVHVSGRYGASVLDPLAQLGAAAVAMHPAMAFSGDRDTELERIAGARFAITAQGPARSTAEALVSDMGGIPFSVAEENRVLYHAALAHASNHLVTLMVESMAMLAQVGVDDPSTVVRPAVVAALENVLQKGFDGVTGPVVRGDLGTIQVHLHAIERCAPTVLDSYRVLSRSTADYALQADRLSAGAHTELSAALRPTDCRL